MLLAEVLTWATQTLSSCDTPRLDAELLLADILNVSRSHFIAFPERALTKDELEKFKQFIAKRQQGIPVAYLLGHREFWSLDFVVTPDTLIPRPETELLVELVLQKISGEEILIADLGTGSGAIALAIAHEKPNWIVHATDVSENALKVATLNAERLHIANVQFYQGAWCQALPGQLCDVVVSNPPYVADVDILLTNSDIAFEPRVALVSADNGLKDLQLIISGARNHLKSNGYLMVEHGFQQAIDVRSIFSTMRYTDINSFQDLAGLDRVTIGKWVNIKEE